MKRLLGIFSIIICLGICVSCGSSSKEPVTAKSVTGIINENSMVTVYDVGETGIVEREDRFQLKQPESIPTSVEEIMNEFTVPESLSYVGYTIDEVSNVIITVGDISASEEEKLLFKAALVRTLSQIHNINKVVIVFEDASGNEIERATYTDASFLYYEQE